MKQGFAIVVVFSVLVLLMLAGSSCYTVNPGTRGVKVTLGKVDPRFLPEGFGFKTPFVTHIETVPVRQETKAMKAECYSSDLQPMTLTVKVLYRIPEQSVVKMFQEYAGDPFDSLVAPRVQEALKEFTAQNTAEQNVKRRELIKTSAMEASAKKIGTLLLLDDIVIENIDLSDQLEAAIEAKMVQEQEASKSKFIQDKAKVEAETVVIKARAEAEAIKIKGEALRESPDLINLNIVEKWDGRAPQVIGGGGASGGGGNGASIILPIQPQRQPDTSGR